MRCIRLNTQQSKPVGLSDAQIVWFRAEVSAALSVGEQILLFQHNYPFQIWEDFDGQNIDTWRGIVQTNRIAAIVCGHTHYFQEANDGRNISVAVRSIGDPEGGAPGYLVGYLHGDDLAFAYRTVEETGPFVLITHPRDTLLATGPRHVVRADDEIRALIRSAAPVVSARWRVDKGEWQDLTLSADDLCTGALSIEGLTKGNHALTVEAQDAQGQTGRREQAFFVDPTGRYTAVPAVRPVVSQTKFC